MFHGGLLKRPGPTRPTLPGSVSKMGSPPPTAPGATAAAVASAAGRRLGASWRPGRGKCYISMCVCVYMYVYTYIYIYIHMCVCMYVYIYIYVCVYMYQITFHISQNICRQNSSKFKCSIFGHKLFLDEPIWPWEIPMIYH